MARWDGLLGACVGEPDLREGYDLGGTVVRSAAFVSNTIARFVSASGLQVLKYPSTMGNF
jgi:hypothetical protein